MAPRRCSNIQAGLQRKGFRSTENSHTRLRLWVNDRKTTVCTLLSHGNPEYDDRRLGWVARELKLRRRELDALIDCDMSYDEYVAQLAREGHIRLPEPQT